MVPSGSGAPRIPARVSESPDLGQVSLVGDSDADVADDARAGLCSEL
jgi:hypothetical protein